MSKSAVRFKEHVTKLIDSGIITKTDLHQKTGLSRPTIDRYLANTPPDLDSLDRIADALECEPSELIKPEGQPILVPHKLEDCILAIANALALGKQRLTKKQLFPPTSTENARHPEAQENGDSDDSTIESIELRTDPIESKIVSLLRSLDDPQRQSILGQIQSLLRTNDRETSDDKPKKKKKSSG